MSYNYLVLVVFYYFPYYSNNCKFNGNMWKTGGVQLDNVFVYVLLYNFVILCMYLSVVYTILILLSILINYYLLLTIKFT